ncbi:MAG: hypothetical protein R3E44_04175 [Paracoccaceae bacterium]
MTELSIAASRIRAGRWEAEISAEAGTPPRIEIWHQDQRLEGLQTGTDLGGGRWPVSVPIPAELLADGVQTFLVSDASNGDRIGAFTVVTGAPLEDDIRAEVDLLRAELDMLKKAFRRHCLETSDG